jgi:hypothetical protein
MTVPILDFRFGILDWIKLIGHMSSRLALVELIRGEKELM